MLGKHHETLELLFLGQQGDDKEIRQHWKYVKKHQTTWMRHQRMLGNIGGHGKKKFLVIKSVEKMLNNDGKMVKNTRKTLRHIK